MKVTIVGAGNIGTQLAVHAAEKGHDVIVFTSKFGKINKELFIVNEKNETIHSGRIHLATANAEKAFQDADLIFVVVPATVMATVAEQIEPYAKAGMHICLVPGTGGGECAFRGCINKGVVLFAPQRVPSVARLVEYGKVVRAIGYRDEMFVAAIPQNQCEKCSKMLEDIIDIKCTPLPNYLNITLTPSNPILHTVRLRNLYGDYNEGTIYEQVPLFYEGWNDETSLDLFNCDSEVQEICKRLSQFDLSYVKSLKDHYESYSVEAMTEKIRSIAGFKGLTSPTLEVQDGFIPDFSSRYFTADFSYGLTILIQIADFLGVATPCMIDNWRWYENLVKPTDTFDFAKYGINNISDFIKFYSE